MADYTPLQTANILPITSTASTSITGGQLVEVSGSGSVAPATADSQRVVGVAAHDAANGARVTVHPLAGGVHELVAGSGGVTAGQPVKAGASAVEVLPLSGGALGAQAGIALTTAAAGGKVQVLGTAAGSSGPLFASASLNFPAVAAAGQQELTITVTGAAVGDAVVLAPPAAPDAGLVWAGRVSAANTVTVRVANITAAPIDPAAATWGAQVIKRT
ncbi:capsid cement protein [Nonomuraea sp. NPDC050383]|uniref:capsid cement protein n=1 Tax=Nonomuraea sp. NPDC050383 TaxID=3364362 RepID=UPI00379FDAE9